MALIKWDNSLSVGVTEFDQQHQKLISMINELNEAMKQRKGKEILSKIVTGLINYTKIHFKAEENYFDRLAYPESINHKREHEAFVTKVSQFKEGFEKGKIGLSIEIMDFLADWLRKHIKVTDAKYSQFFNEKSIK